MAPQCIEVIHGRGSNGGPLATVNGLPGCLPELRPAPTLQPVQMRGLAYALLAAAEDCEFQWNRDEAAEARYSLHRTVPPAPPELLRLVDELAEKAAALRSKPARRSQDRARWEDHRSECLAALWETLDAMHPGLGGRFLAAQFEATGE